MTPTFSDSARRLAGLTPRLLGWRPDDIWGATPAELAAILAADADHAAPDPLSRAELDKLMEQDRNGR